MSDRIRQLVQTILDGKSWSIEQSHEFFSGVVRGEVEPVLLAAAISAIKVRGQSEDELSGAAKAQIESALPFPRPDFEFADIVGTGGDGHNTINLSTIAAITAAACGCKIVKHGNRSISSCSGSFDFLESLHVPFEIDPAESRRQVDTYGICFLYAPRYHSGLRHAASVRTALKVRTIFNLLGPLVNPARSDRILLGVADSKLLMPMAKALQSLGCQKGFVVHGSGVDEVAVHGPTQVVQTTGGSIQQYELSPEDFGAERFKIEDLVCHDARESHQRSRRVLDGQGSEAENAAVCLNVAMVLKLFGRDDLTGNYQQASNVLRSGQPGQLVNRLAQGD